MKYSQFFLLLLTITLFNVNTIFGQVWVQASIHTKPNTILLGGNQDIVHLSYNEDAGNYGLIDRTYWEFDIGYKNFYIGYGRFGQMYEQAGFYDMHEADWADLDYWRRYVHYKDYRIGFTHQLDWFSYDIYFDISKFSENRRYIYYWGQSPKIGYSSYEGRGYGYGAKLSIRLIENLHVGMNGNYVYYKDFYGKDIVRLNAFVKYKYTFNWKK